MKKEILEKRNLNSKHFDIGNGKFLMEAHCGHIHYQDRTTKKFENCNVAFRDENGEFVMDKASYEIRVPKKLNKVKFRANDKEMSIEPIGIKPNVEGRITDDPETEHKKNTIRFDNVYGQGIHLEFVCRTGSLKKYIVFDERPKKLDWKFKLVGYDKNKHILRKPRIFDKENSQEIEYDIKGRILTKHLPEAFFNNAIYPVRTDTTTSYYAGAGDGAVWNTVAGQPSQANWDTAHDAATGSEFTYTGDYVAIGTYFRGSSDDTRVYRGFYPIDTSCLGATAVISAAVLKLYKNLVTDAYNGDGYDYVAVVQTDQPNSAVLTTADYNNCGATDNPTKGSADVDLTGIGAGYNDFTLNATGRSWIQKTGTTMLGIREGHDIQDNFPGDPGAVDKYSRAFFDASERGSTAQDPYLSVTYTTGGATGIMTCNKLW